MDSAPAIYIVDDDLAFRTSLSALLKVRTPFGISEFADGAAWLEEEQSLPPGCLLLDYSMPNLSGLAVLEEMRGRGSAHQVVMITGEGNISVAVHAMRAGAHDFLEKPVAFDTLIEAINLAVQRLGDDINAKNGVLHAQQRIDRLKPRERDIMLNLADGHPNKVIAHKLGLSVRTVEVYRANLMDKLEVRSLADLIKLVFNAGLMPASKDKP